MTSATRICTECGDIRVTRERNAVPGGIIRRRCAPCHGRRLAPVPAPEPFPRDDIDDQAVRMVVRSERGDVDLNIAERIEVTVQLTERGRTAEEIAHRLRVTTRSVVRYRKEARQTGRLSHVAVDLRRSVTPGPRPARHHPLAA